MESNEIIKRIMEIFSLYGVRASTMDFIAQSIPLPKRQLLEIAKNKEGLILHIFNYRMKRSEELFQEIEKEFAVTNAIDQLLYISVFMHNKQDDFKPMLDFEFNKYYSEVYDVYKKQMQQQILTGIIQNIERGKHEGVYRTDVDAEISAHIYIDRLYMLHTQSLHNEIGCDAHDVFFEALANHIRGISSIEGIRYFDEKKQLLYSLIKK